MPQRRTLERAKADLREGKSPNTAAGEFVREEMENFHEGKHHVRSAKQAIAIGLSKARLAGVPLEPPRGGKRTSWQSVRRAYDAGQAKRNTRTLSKKAKTASRDSSDGAGRDEAKDSSAR